MSYKAYTKQKKRRTEFAISACIYVCARRNYRTYSYEQEGDYNKNINIKFDGSLPQKMSEDEVHLKEIMQIQE